MTTFVTCRGYVGGEQILLRVSDIKSVTILSSEHAARLVAEHRARVDEQGELQDVPVRRPTISIEVEEGGMRGSMVMGITDGPEQFLMNLCAAGATIKGDVDFPKSAAQASVN